MAETEDIMVKNTEPRNSASMIDRGTEDNSVGGVSGTTTNHIVETSDSRKRPGGSSPGKVRVHLNLKFGFTFEMLRLFLNVRPVETLNCVFMSGIGW